MVSNVKSMQTAASAAFYDVEGAPMHGLQAQTWPVPEHVEVRDGRLVGDWRAGVREQGADENVLRRFLGLADASDAAVLDYARRWGILMLCGHDLPTYHDATHDAMRGRVLDGQPGRWCVEPAGPTFSESIEVWRDYAARAAALVSLALVLRGAVELDASQTRETWFTMVFGKMAFEDGRLASEREQTTAQAPAEGAALGYSVADVLDRWMRLGRVRLAAEWTGDRLGTRLGGGRIPGLFGAIAGGLFLAATGSSLALCHSCGRPYLPARRPASGRRSYCDACRTSGVPNRDSAREWYRRNSSGVGQ